ncbi:MAG: hypothetical protein AB8B48_21210 [Pseudomonadales bacterium]
MNKRTLLSGGFAALLAIGVIAGDHSYAEVAKRHGSTKLTAEQVSAAKMQGECLVGLKDLNFKKMNTFDPVAEWSNYRTISLLEQFPPCDVLIMMEVAQGTLKARPGK